MTTRLSDSTALVPTPQNIVSNLIAKRTLWHNISLQLIYANNLSTFPMKWLISNISNWDCTSDDFERKQISANTCAINSSVVQLLPPKGIDNIVKLWRNCCYSYKRAVTLINIANNDDIDNIDNNRERYVSGVCALDLVNEISQETLVRVLRLMI